MKVIYGVDVGGTFIKIGKFSLDGLINKYSIKTIISEDYHAIINQISNLIDETIEKDELVGIGIAIPGPCVEGVVLGCHNIKWGKVYLKEELEKKYPEVLIAVLNDANSACLGEWKYSDYSNYSNLVLITLGTGVGGGIVINNKLIEGIDGSTGELGHIRLIPFNGRKCTCGLEGCLESYTSIRGIVQTALEYKEGKLTTLNNYDTLTSKIIFDEAKNGDACSQKVVDTTCYFLAMGISNISNILNPDCVIIGGGVSLAGDYLLERVKYYFDKLVFYSIKSTKITLAKLHNDAGIYGSYYEVLNMMNE